MALRVIVMFTGRPVRALAMPASSHPPRILEGSPALKNCLPGPKGRS